MSRHEIEKKLSVISNREIKGCGLNYELYEERFFYCIDGLVASSDPSSQALILSVAKDEYGYKPEAERALEDDSWKEGLCSHYFDPHCCPLGCGDL